jgi:hypothetical protein
VPNRKPNKPAAPSFDPELDPEVPLLYPDEDDPPLLNPENEDGDDPPLLNPENEDEEDPPLLNPENEDEEDPPLLNPDDEEDPPLLKPDDEDSPPKPPLRPPPPLGSGAGAARTVARSKAGKRVRIWMRIVVVGERARLGFSRKGGRRAFGSGGSCVSSRVRKAE